MQDEVPWALGSRGFALMHRKPALFPPYLVIASRDKLGGRSYPMKELTFVLDERELSTIRAALYLLQEQVDALPEDLAEMLAEHGKPMTEVEIERLSLRLGEPTSLTRASADQEFPRTNMVVEVERFAAASIARGPA